MKESFIRIYTALIYFINVILKISYFSKLDSPKLNKFYKVCYLPYYYSFALDSDNEYSRY